MASRISLLVLSLSSLAFAIPGPMLGARQETSTQTVCPTPYIEGYACFSLAPSSYASSLCSTFGPQVVSYTTTTPTITATSTSYIETQIVPTLTVTTISTIYDNTTTTESDISTVTSGTSTSYSSTTTTTVTEFSTQYTCAGLSSVDSPSATVPVTKRQAPATVTATGDAAAQTCVESYTSAYGTFGIRSACECAFDAATTETVVRTIPGSVTITESAVVSATLTASGTLTNSLNTTTQATVTITDFTTQTVPPAGTGVYTVTSTTTSIVTAPSEFPDSFQLAISTNDRLIYGSLVQISTGTELAFRSDSTSSSGSSFSTTEDGQLVTSDALFAVAGQTKINAVPYVYFLTQTAATDPSSGTFLLSFDICDSALRASYPNSEENIVMQLCEAGGQEILAIGPASAFPDEGEGAEDNCQGVQVVVVPEVSLSGTGNSTMSGVASATEWPTARPTKRGMMPVRVAV